MTVVNLCLLLFLVLSCVYTENFHGMEDKGQSWDYVTVRPKAHMFYWLYETTHSSGYKNRPLILWLQGGPGGSGVGYGNFEELGPLDVDLKPRKTTWLQTASLLFIDNPVGTGYSYVEDLNLLAKNGSQISADLLTCMKSFIDKHPEFKDIPFYIFSESYGGKMTAEFSLVLYQAIQSGDIQMNFKGLAMGDSWIAPADITLSWGPYLYATSIVDEAGLKKINIAAQKAADDVKKGKMKEATGEWSKAEAVVEEVSGGVNFYNILDWDDDEDTALTFKSEKTMTYMERSIQRHVKALSGDPLTDLMNGPIRDKLKIIPKNVTWGGQGDMVFTSLVGDFMREVTSTVNQLIKTTELTVVVYEGQLDLICDTLGAEKWFSKLDIASAFVGASRSLHTCKETNEPCYYIKKLDNVQFYWVLKAGHMVPADNGYGALDMVNNIIGA